MRRAKRHLWLSLLFLGACQTAWAVVPMEYFYGLVAGQGDVGNRDGAFNQALFGEPSGLALNDDETTLYVADAGNHTLRAIALDHHNTVSTLAGTGQRGAQDGAFAEASFDRPRNIVLLPDNTLALYDSGNACVRLVDLTQRTVRLWFRLAEPRADGKDPDPALRIHSMVYSAEEKTLYFSQPDSERVMRIQPGESQPTAAFPQRNELVLPGPLALLKGKLVVGSLHSGKIFTLEALQNMEATPEPIGSCESLATLQAFGETLYALSRKGEKILRPLDNTFTFLPTGAGYPAENITIPWFLLPSNDTIPQWVPSKKSEKKFYVTSFDKPTGVYYFKDYNYTQLKDQDTENSAFLSDFEYPKTKPQGTFRILMVGDSHVYFISKYDDRSRCIPPYSRMLNTAKRLEWQLNSRAALRDSSAKYEVLLLAHAADDNFPITLWPYYLVPDAVKTYDADLVLYMAIPQVHPPCSHWFTHPISSEGIPEPRPDAEYYLKPWAQKAPKGTERRKFLDLGLKNKLIEIEPNGYAIHVAESIYIFKNRETTDAVMALMGKPLGMLSKKMSSLRTKAGAPVPFYLCYAPLTTRSLEDYQYVWRGIAKKQGLPLFDLTDDLVALRDTILPSRESGHEHLMVEGHDFLAQVLADALLRQRLIPAGGAD